MCISYYLSLLRLFLERQTCQQAIRGIEYWQINVFDWLALPLWNWDDLVDAIKVELLICVCCKMLEELIQNTSAYISMISYGQGKFCCEFTSHSLWPKDSCLLYMPLPSKIFPRLPDKKYCQATSRSPPQPQVKRKLFFSYFLSDKITPGANVCSSQLNYVYIFRYITHFLVKLVHIRERK